MDIHLIYSLSELVLIFIGLGFTIRILQNRVKSLNDQVEIQSDTLKAMEQRLSETEKITDVYKTFTMDFSKLFNDYRSNISISKDEVIDTLEKKTKVQEQELRDHQSALDYLEKILESREEQLNVRVFKIISILLDKKKKGLSVFLSNISKDEKQVIQGMIERKTLEELLSILGLKVQVLFENENLDFFNANFLNLNEVREAVNTQGGSYMLTKDNRLVIDKILFEKFKSEYEN